MGKWGGTQDSCVPRTPVGMATVVSKENRFLSSHPCFLSDSRVPLCLCLTVFSSNNHPHKHEDLYAHILLSALQA